MIGCPRAWSVRGVAAVGPAVSVKLGSRIPISSS
jgi:hypothetical protein